MNFKSNWGNFPIYSHKIVQTNEYILLYVFTRTHFDITIRKLEYENEQALHFQSIKSIWKIIYDIWFLVLLSDIPADDILELFGKTFFEFCQDSGYDKILQVLGATPRDFLQVQNFSNNLTFIFLLNLLFLVSCSFFDQKKITEKYF